MVMVKDMTQLTVKDLCKEVKDEEEWQGDLKEDTQRLIKRILESTEFSGFLADASGRTQADACIGCHYVDDSGHGSSPQPRLPRFFSSERKSSKMASSIPMCPSLPLR